MNRLQTLTRLAVRQRIRMTVNQYEVRALLPDGSEGEMIAFAQQKRMAFKEQVTLYSDGSKQYPVLGFRARQVLDFGATYDVTDHNGQPIGNFRKDFAQSLLRSTWHLEQPGLFIATGQERNQVLALLRRFVDAAQIIPYHFDFQAGRHPIFSVDKRFGVRDRYTVHIPDPNVDRRLVIAMAVALDALQAR
ncbi:hypothetical protein ACFQZ2_10130 [Streptomonospora algeriensis]|uniref:Uncharacterized protein n=1 Tax=Streptomonospora algeriensis TaxID=995084 RepID=A0ABW3BG28_9ACTN